MNIEIANRLVQLRKSNNLSQEALAEKLGISRQAVSKWERAEASPDTDNLILLARLYQISLDELLKTEDEIPEPAYREEEIIKEEDRMKEQEDAGRDWSWPASGLPVYLIVTIAYLFIGCFFGAWHPGWLLFLLPGIWNSFVWAVRERNALCFAYPVLVTFLYLCIGIFANAWHPGWILFITIPLYYPAVRWIRMYAGRYSGSREKAGDSDEER